MLNKIPYYLSSMAALWRSSTNPGALFRMAAGKRLDQPLCFSSGLQFRLHGRLDLLVLKEILLDDCYRLHDVRLPKRIVDLGAGVGLFSIHAALQFPEALVVSLEPQPKAFALFKENLKLNKIRNVTALNMAVGNEESVKLILSADHARTSAYDLSNDQGTCIVPAVSLSSLLSEPIDLLKVDIEGAESTLFDSLGAKEFERIKRIHLEYHDYLIPDLAKKTMARLKSAGFICDLAPDPYTPTFGYIFAERN